MFDKKCPMCRMSLLHDIEEHFYYGGKVKFDFEKVSMRPSKKKMKQKVRGSIMVGKKTSMNMMNMSHMNMFRVYQ